MKNDPEAMKDNVATFFFYYLKLRSHCLAQGTQNKKESYAGKNICNMSKGFEGLWINKRTKWNSLAKDLSQSLI